MQTTSVSLLMRLRLPNDKEAWDRFVELYAPLLFHWANRAGMQAGDAADLVQDVFLVLVRKLPEFLYDEHKSFRAWLRTILFNQWRDRLRRARAIPETQDPEALANASIPDNTQMFGEMEYRERLVGRALELMKVDFQPTTWRACWEVIVESRPAAEVGAELGISIDSVYAAKSRVLRRLRSELDGLLE
jgi:RNA polymerase sigma-70 factor (ECF subfamily)